MIVIIMIHVSEDDIKYFKLQSLRPNHFHPFPAKGHKVQAWLSSHFQENISWFQLPEIPTTHPDASQGQGETSKTFIEISSRITGPLG